MSEITIAVTGLVATAIRHSFTAEGLEISSFRLAATHRKFDRETRSWVDAETNWFTITAFRQLAANINASVEKGHRVVVSGRLRVNDWVDGERTGKNVEIIADALGPDLAWGTARYSRTPRAAGVGSEAVSDAEPAEADAPAETAAEPPHEAFPTEAQLASGLPF